MGPDELARLMTETLYLVLWMSAPVLVVSLVVGLISGLMSAMTQVHDQALTFVPKLVAVGLTLVVAGTWMSSELVRFTQVVWESIPVI